MLILFLNTILSLGSSKIHLSKSEVLIIESSNTPIGLLNTLSDFPNTISINNRDYMDIIENIKCNFYLILDITYQSSFYYLLDKIALHFGTVYFTLTPPSGYTSPWRFYVHTSYEEEARAIQMVIESLNIRDIVLMSSITYNNIHISDNINPHNILMHLKYQVNAFQDVLDNLVGKMIKSNGYKHVIAVDDGESWSKLQNSFINKNLATVGFFIISNSRSICNTILEGSLVVVESGLELAESMNDYESKAILNILSDINAFIEALNIYTLNSETVSRIVRSLYPNRIRQPAYSIINIVNSTRKTVGTVNNAVNLYTTILYPGNTTDILAMSKTKIVISIANGTDEIYNLYKFTEFSYQMGAAIYSANISNSINEIPGFEITFFPTDCGIFYYDETFYTNYYNQIADSMGVAYLTAPWAEVAYGNMATLKKLGNRIPQISYFSQNDIVNNSTSFPEFFKMSASNQDYFSSVALFFSSLNWNNYVIFLVDDPGFQTLYDQLIVTFTLFNIYPVNPVNKRIFPMNYTKDDFEQYRDYFQEAKDTNCMTFYIMHQNKAAILEGMYDIGLRKKDVIAVLDAGTLYGLNTLEQESILKVEEFLEGALVYAYKEWSGELGVKLKAEMSPMFPKLIYICMVYDSFNMIKESIIYALSRGENYEDHEILSHIIRTNKITGCLGTVYFESESNSRSSAQFSISQISKNTTSGNWVMNYVVNINKFSEKYMTVLSPYKWPMGSSIPDNFRSPPSCPFDDFQIMDSAKGQYALIIISGMIFLASTSIAFYSYKKYEDLFKYLMTRQEISFSDMLYIFNFFSQFIQLLSLGPEQDSLYYLFNNFHETVALDVMKYLDLKYNNFWIAILILFTITLAWLLVFLSIFICKAYVINETEIFRNTLIPVFTDICFLPIFSMLLQVYVCKQGIGDDLRSSFLENDCYKFCYQGWHLIACVLSGICILVHITTVIYLRPLVEYMQSSLHLCTKSSYLSILSVFQVTVVILSKILKIYSSYAQAGGLCGAILILIVITACMQPYNTKRTYFFQLISLAMAFWGLLTFIIFKHTGNARAWCAVEIFGFFAIGFGGYVYIAREPNMIYLKRGYSIERLFKFQFTNDPSFIETIRSDLGSSRLYAIANTRIMSQE